MRVALTSFVAFAALIVGLCAGYLWGRHAGRVESGPGFSQAAQNGYEEGFADGKAGKDATGPRLIRL